MKLHNASLLSFLLAIVMVAGLLPITAYASNQNISGLVYASTIPDNSEIMLSGDTTLVMDVSKTIQSITGRDYALTIQGSKTLIVNNSSTSAINARIKITENWEKLDENGDVIDGETLPLVVNGRNMAVINFANASSWTLKSDGYYYYSNDIPTGGASNSFIESVTFNCDATSEYSSARYHLNLKVETVEASNAARQTAGWI